MLKYFYLSGFLSNLRLPWKTRVYAEFLHCIEIFLSFRIFDQIALALKNRVCPEFTVLNIYFYHSEFWTTCACPENRVCPEIFTALKYSLSVRIFEQFALALKTEFVTKFFTALNIFFTIHRNFEQLCPCPEKQSVPWNFSLDWNLFYLSEFWITSACPEIELPCIFHCIEYTFCSQDFWATCACPEKQSVPWIFKPGAAAPSRLLRHVWSDTPPMWYLVVLKAANFYAFDKMQSLHLFNIT